MPVKFLKPEQITAYGQYRGEPSTTQLGMYFHLDDFDLEVMAPWRTDHTRLGFALQLSAVRFVGNFIADLSTTPKKAVTYLARQLGISDLAGWERYMRSKTQARHRQLIRERYGYEDFHSSSRVLGLLRYLYAQTWLVEHKVLLPGATVLERCVAQIVHRTNRRLWRGLSALPDQEQKERLEALLVPGAGQRHSTLERLRREERRASSRTMLSALQRLESVRGLGLQSLDLSAWPVRRIQGLARYGMTAWAQTLTQLEDDRRLATLLAVSKELEANIQDEVLDLFMMLTKAKFKTAQKEG